MNMWLDEILYRMGIRARRAIELKERFILQEFPNKGMILLPGIRGVGKSIALLQLFHRVGGYLVWVDELRLFYGKSLIDLFKEIERREGILEASNTPVMLDEVHYDPDWPEALKWLSDVFRGLVIATGSSTIAFQLSPELARRASVMWMWPLSFYEWLHLRGERVNPVKMEVLLRSGANPEYRPGFERFLREGGLPVTFDLGLDAVTRSVERVIFNDMLVLGRFDRRTISLTPQIIKRLSTDPAISVERLASEVGLSKPTVIAVLDYLEKAGLIIQLRPFGPLSSIRKGLKRYFVTPTIRYSLVRPHYYRGLLLEEYVASQLYLVSLRNGWSLTFWPGEGPDFVLEMGDRKLGIEVGFGRKDRRQASKALDKVDEILIISEEGPVSGNRVRWIPLDSFYRGY